MGVSSPGPADWDRLEALFEAARALPEIERGAFLETACAGDAWLEAELRSLIACMQDAEIFFGRMADVASTGIAAAARLRPSPTGDSTAPAAAVRGLEPAAPLPELSVGPYRLQEVLGRGGMGVVYRALDPRLDRTVALKFLPSHVSADEETRQRFLVEARAAASLDHPNICTVYEVGETDEPRPFLAMACYAGETLEQKIARSALPPAEAIGYALQIAQGLAAAHSRGILHRDIKPANVMVTVEGVVKILDFGLARFSDATTTRPGGTQGTLAYMAPERALGRAGNQRADLWSLGVVLYEMLTGMRPFRADSDAALLYAIVHEKPEPLPTTQPDATPGLARIIVRLLEKDPARRYASAHDVLLDLESVSGGRPAMVGARPRTRAPAVLVAGLMGVLVMLAAVSWMTREPAIPPGAAAFSPSPRIAVLFFDDETEGNEFGWVAHALTTGLVGTLASVRGLDVLSLNAVRPYRGSALPLRAVAGNLAAEWLVGGSVNRVDGRIAVTAELIDGSTARRLDQRERTRPVGEEMALIEEVVQEVADMLRGRLGPEVRLRRWQAGTRSHSAFHLLQLASRDVADADMLAGSTQPRSAWAALRRADSTLARAALSDPAWAEPLIERAWVARKAAFLGYGLGAGPDSVAAELRAGIQFADEALRLQGNDARALEVRGVLRHAAWLLLARSADSAAARQWLEEAERDLRTALENDSTLAGALNVLSSIEYAHGRFEPARLIAERAYRADAFLEAEEGLYRLFNVTFEAGRDRDATHWCAEITRRFPESWFVVHCRLMLMAWDPAAGTDVDEAWNLARRAAADAPAPLRAVLGPQLDVLVAGVLARAGLRDSAQHVLLRTRAAAEREAQPGAAPNGGVVRLQFEAGVRVILGELDIARALLQEYFEQLPAERVILTNSRRFEVIASDLAAARANGR